jgi:3-oxoacyl-[acyl-carrier-protein] synthase-3
MKISIRAIEHHLPEKTVTNEALAAEFPEWSVQKIQSKTGILERHIAAPGECSSDLGYVAAKRLFDSGACTAEQIDFLLLCTQSPDYFLPTTACLLQDRLGIPVSAGALDFNLGCSGFVYGLGLAQGLLRTGQATRLLLITAETYSKFIHPGDKSVRTLFGDAAAATLIEAAPGEDDAGPACFVYGTDGRGGANLIVVAGGFRTPRDAATAEVLPDDSGNVRSQDNLYMNGAEIFNFTLSAVPESVHRLLDRAGKTLDEVDLFVFHQANQYMLEHLRRKLGIPREKFVLCLSRCGNTVSSTIPIALQQAAADGKLHDGQLVMLVGFGVGYSWGAALMRWPAL